MELTTPHTVLPSQTVAAAAAAGADLRLLQPSQQFINVSTPQMTWLAPPAIPWSRATADTAAAFSGLCLLIGLGYSPTPPPRTLGIPRASTATAAVPVGLMDVSWGGTSIRTWLPLAASVACNSGPGAGPVPTHVASSGPVASSAAGLPTLNMLYDAWVAPLARSVPMQAVFWYQGEADTATPDMYVRCFPALIDSWRAAWRAGAGAGPGGWGPSSGRAMARPAAGASTASAASGRTRAGDGGRDDGGDGPFVFVQVSTWPTGGKDSCTAAIPPLRAAQTAALLDPHVAMAVAADLGDPASTFHPIHPPFKVRLAARAILAAAALGVGDVAGRGLRPLQPPGRVGAAGRAAPRGLALAPLPSEAAAMPELDRPVPPGAAAKAPPADARAGGPQVVAVEWDAWSPTWGDFHDGTGGGDPAGLCWDAPGYYCGGIRVRFDVPVAFRSLSSADERWAAGRDGAAGSTRANRTAAASGASAAAAADGTAAWATLVAAAGAATQSQPWPGMSNGWGTGFDVLTTGGQWQPVALLGLADAVTVQLNITSIFGPPATVRYAWADYPTMPIVGAASGLPAVPFEASVRTTTGFPAFEAGRRRV